jgi:DNA-binding NarL/FixJ family response regulator
MATKQTKIAPPKRRAKPSVAIRSSEKLPTEAIERVLGAAGYPLAEFGDSPVVVSAYRRPGGAACAEVRELSLARGEPRVIMVVEEAGAVEVRRAIQAGARAVVTGVTVETALIPSINAALAGQIAIPSRMGARGAPSLLTTREKQILGLVVMGMTNAAIASQLYLAESTVKSHLSSAFAKLGVSSRSEAASVILDPRSAGLGILTISTKSRP